MSKHHPRASSLSKDHDEITRARVDTVDGDEGFADGGAVVAATDTVGAGPGDRVLWTTAYEAAIPWKRLHPVDLAATDASVVAILDRFGPRGEAR